MTRLQTFLPYPDFYETADILDRQRLGKQRVENLQIMQTLLGMKVANTTYQEETGKTRLAYFDDDDMEITGAIDNEDAGQYHPEEVPIYRVVPAPKHEWTLHLAPGGWHNHPCVKMWKGYEWLLLEYQKVICEEWMARGYRDTCFEKTMFLFMPRLGTDMARDLVRPTWLGDDRLHRSHKSSLIRKDPDHYEKFFPDVPNDIPNYWPSEDQ